MCTMGQCRKYHGGWVQFSTPWGTHRGVIEGVNNRAVLMRVPRQYAPAGLVHDVRPEDATDVQKLDLGLAQWGGYGAYGAYGAPGYGYGYGRWGYPGYGAWGGGWWWWWLAFASIFALAFLWW